MRTAIALLLLTTACSPAQRVVVGGGIAAVGVGVTYAALESMAGPCPQPRGPDGVCSSYSAPTARPTVGIPVVLGGLGVVALGGVIMATAVEHGESPPATAPATPQAPEKPSALGKTEAVGMVVARLVLRGAPAVNANSKPEKLLGVDDTQSTLRVEDQHAELWNLHVRTASDGTWHTVGACYEFENEWQLVSLGARPGCGW